MLPHILTNWVLEDIQDKIDPNNLEISKAFPLPITQLVFFIHSIKVLTRSNIGTVVLTDFSKGFDMIDHNILIENFIHLGVRRSNVPWLCDFVSNRAQSGRYNQAISEYKVRGALSLEAQNSAPLASKLSLMMQPKTWVIRSSAESMWTI